ncbi:MAG: hypothetical protein ACRD63_00860 [Pyrinomonadaceae bacterium]
MMLNDSVVLRRLIVLPIIFLVCLFYLNQAAYAQVQVDKMVAMINGTNLITYSDLLWQLALQPNSPLDNPGPDELQQALQLVIDQKLISQEAEKLPLITPTEKEIKDGIDKLIRRFSSRTEFDRRVRRVGLTSERLFEIVQKRVEIEKYLDFRFRAFSVALPSEVESYYAQVYVPNRRRQAPGEIIPTLDEARQEITNTLIENKLKSDIDNFLDNARQSADIIMLNPVRSK